jgi:hypothetical protein
MCLIRIRKLRTKKPQTHETRVKRQCIALLKTLGGYSLPIPGGLMGTRGAPDRICWYHGRAVATEFKKPTGKLSEAQEAIRQKIESTGGTYAVIRSLEDFVETFNLPVKGLF